MSDEEFHVYYNAAAENLLNPLINVKYLGTTFEHYRAASEILSQTYKESIKRIKERERMFKHDLFARLQELNFAAGFYAFVKEIAAEHFVREGLIRKVS